MSASHPSPCKTCDGSGEVETGQTTSARCYNCKGTGVHPSEAEGRTPLSDEQEAMTGAWLLREEAGCVAYCMRCDQRAAWKSDERKAAMYAAADAIERLAARSPAPSDDTQSIPMPSAERCREFNLPASIGATSIPASMLVRNTSDRVEISAAPSVEARDATLLGYPLRVDSSIPADEIRFVQNGQIVGVIRLAASLLPPEKT